MSGYQVDTVYQDFKIQRGVPFSRTAILYDQTTGQPVPNGSYTAATLKLSTAKSGGTIALTLTLGSGITFGGVNGATTWGFTAAQTNGLSPGYYYGDVMATDGSSVPAKLVSSRYEVEETPQ